MRVALGHKLYTPRSRLSQAVAVWLVLAALGGCQAVPDLQQTASINALRGEIEVLRDELSSTQESLLALSTQEAEQGTAITRSLKKIDQRIGKLPGSVVSACREAQQQQPAQPKCEETMVIKQDDQMVLGELERVWLEPPGIALIARIDTGADSSSVNAQNLVEFERDGDDWVRFEWSIEGETTSIERPIERYVRVVQQADPEGTRRPVVSLRLRIGDTEDDFDFSLADRSHLDHQLNLGRNFLTDLAVVDVSRQFIQPSKKSSK